MTPLELHARIERLPERTPLTEAFEARGDLQGTAKVWYHSQKEHWLGWLADYGGPGAYGRKNSERDARFIYNHFQCAPGLLWLAEAAGVDEARLVAGCDAMVGVRQGTQSAAFRRVVPWALVEAALERQRPVRQDPATWLRAVVKRLTSAQRWG